VTATKRDARCPPKGTTALDALESLFAPATQWAVTVTKATTRAVVVFSVHDSEREADSVVTRLRQFGLDAASLPTRSGVVAPGMTVNTKARPA
jgi:hypothetical protein